jgi:fatty-acyl-CoA synthase
MTKLASMVRALASANPERNALIVESACASPRTVTAQQFVQSLDQTIGYLKSLVLPRSAVVAYCALNSDKHLLLLLACEHLGLVLMPLNWRLSTFELQRQIDHAGAQLILSEPELAQLASTLRSAPAPTPISFGAVLLVYTSGSTGAPKGALYGTEQLLANAVASWAAHDLNPHDIVLSALPFFHMGGLCIQTLPAFLLGVPVVIQDRFDATRWLSAIERYRVSLSLVVPPVMLAILEADAFEQTNLKSLRLVMAGSSIVPTELIQRFHRCGVTIGQVYGATETGPVSIVLKQSEALDQVGWCGRPAVGVSVRLVEGELQLQAPNLMLGYLGEPVRAQNDWYATGDLAEKSDQGFFRILGRARELIISGGENIHPAEIEQWLNQWPSIAESAVVGVTHQRWGHVPVAVLVPTRPELASDEEAQRIDRFLFERLARFKRPSQYIWVDSLPKSALGKVIKSVLIEQLKL